MDQNPSLKTAEAIERRVKLIEATRTAAKIMLEMIEAAGPDGIPSGHFYAMLMPTGMSHNVYTNMLMILKHGRCITETGFVLRFLNHPPT